MAHMYVSHLAEKHGKRKHKNEQCAQFHLPHVQEVYVRGSELASGAVSPPSLWVSLFLASTGGDSVVLSVHGAALKILISYLGWFSAWETVTHSSSGRKNGFIEKYVGLQSGLPFLRNS